MAASDRRGAPAPLREAPRLGWRAGLLVACVLAACAGCDNLVARVEGGSETGVDDAEVGLTF